MSALRELMRVTVALRGSHTAALREKGKAELDALLALESLARETVERCERFEVIWTDVRHFDQALKAIDEARS